MRGRRYLAVLLAMAFAGTSSGAARQQAKPALIPAVVALEDGNPANAAFAFLDPKTLQRVGPRVPLGKMNLGGPTFVAQSPSGARVALATSEQVILIDLHRHRVLGKVPGRFSGALAWPVADRVLGVDSSGDVDQVVVIDPDRESVIARRDIPGHTTLQQSATPRELVVLKDTGLGSPLSIVAHGPAGVVARIGLGLIRSGVENARTASGMPPQAQKAIDASRRDLARRAGTAVAQIRTLAITPGVWTFLCCLRLEDGRARERLPSSCNERREPPVFTTGSWAYGYAIILAAGGRVYRYHALLPSAQYQPSLCASYPSAEAPPLPVNNLVEARRNTSHGRVQLVAAPSRRVLVFTGDGRIGRIDLASRKLNYILLHRRFPAGAWLDDAGRLGAEHIAIRVYERLERPADAAIWSVDLKERTARLVVRDRHGCAELTTGAGLMLVHIRAELPVIHASCRGLSGYGADGRLRFRLFRNHRVSRVQVAGPRAYATLGGDPERGVQPRRIAIVDLGRGRIVSQIPMDRRIDLLLPD